MSLRTPKHDGCNAPSLSVVCLLVQKPRPPTEGVSSVRAKSSMTGWFRLPGKKTRDLVLVVVPPQTCRKESPVWALGKSWICFTRRSDIDLWKFQGMEHTISYIISIIHIYLSIIYIKVRHYETASVLNSTSMTSESTDGTETHEGKWHFYLWFCDLLPKLEEKKEACRWSQKKIKTERNPNQDSLKQTNKHAEGLKCLRDPTHLALLYGIYPILNVFIL